MKNDQAPQGWYKFGKLNDENYKGLQVSLHGYSIYYGRADIIKAVNSHDALVEALKKAFQFCQNLKACSDCEHGEYPELLEIVPQLEKALAQAEAE